MSIRPDLEVLQGGVTERRDTVLLPPGRRLTDFIEAAAQAGLSPSEAVRMAVERALVVADGRLFGLSSEGVRYVLAGAARRVRLRQPLGEEQAAYVRRLTARRPTRAPQVRDGMRVSLPESLLARATGVVRLSALDPAVVDEMIGWEVAATIDGRTMGEWGLKSMASARRAG